VDGLKFLTPRSTPVAGLSANSSARYYFVDSAQLNAIFFGHEHLQINNFPSGNGDANTLDLKPAHSPIDATTQFVEGTPNGDVPIPAPQFTAYRGKVLGEPNSKVFLTAFNGQILCSITRETGEVFTLGPAKNLGEAGMHILVRENDLLALTGFAPLNCIADDIPQPNALVPIDILLANARKTDAPGVISPEPLVGLLQTDIAVEADSCFYHAVAGSGTNNNAVLGYIASLFAMSSSIYEDEVNITWHLTTVILWAKNDPYNVNGNAYALEPLVIPYWKAHHANVQRDLAHIMTSINYGGGGYGYFSLCDTNYSYSMSSPTTGHSYPTFAFTYDAYIVAHEIGHNFSLPHSHTCYWDPPLDTCWTKDDPSHGLKIGDACDSLPITPRRSPGTIMSYCANTNFALSGNDFSQFKLNMTFSPKVDSVLRVNALKAACIQPPSDTMVILLSPRGSESYNGDSMVTILWTFAHVDSVGLQYSPNNGSSWITIVRSVPANSESGSYAWKVPNISSQNMLVRVTDVKDQSIADTSLLVFTTTAAAGVTGVANTAGISVSPEPAHETLTLTTPESGEIRYEILDANGVSVRSGVTSGNNSINLASLPPGAYFLRITSPSTAVVPFVHE